MCRGQLRRIRYEGLSLTTDSAPQDGRVSICAPSMCKPTNSACNRYKLVLFSRSFHQVRVDRDSLSVHMFNL